MIITRGAVGPNEMQRRLFRDVWEAATFNKEKGDAANKPSDIY